jgi:hypothetical protein
LHFQNNILWNIFPNTNTERDVKMKRMFIGLAVILACAVLTGCSSVPQFPNLTGQWKYQFTESGKKDVETGSMKLQQNCFKLSGQANDAFGEFALEGTVDGGDVVINGVKNDKKRSFKISADLETENSFSGTYTTDQNTSGRIWGSRILSK